MGKRYYYERIGVNSRLDSIQAAILNIKLKHLDQYAERRNKAAAHYDNFFKQIPGVKIPARAKKFNTCFSSIHFAN